MNLLRMADLDLAGKRLLIREDLNVPVKDGQVTSEQRITLIKRLVGVVLFIAVVVAVWYFEPENATALASVIRSLMENPKSIETAGQNGRKYVAEHFNRDQIAASLYKRLTSIS